jgi:hypothetical protein
VCVPDIDALQPPVDLLVVAMSAAQAPAAPAITARAPLP